MLYRFADFSRIGTAGVFIAPASYLRFPERGVPFDSRASVKNAYHLAGVVVLKLFKQTFLLFKQKPSVWLNGGTLWNVGVNPGLFCLKYEVWFSQVKGWDRAGIIPTGFRIVLRRWGYYFPKSSLQSAFA